MKKMVFLFLALFLFQGFGIAKAETLSKGAPICITKEYFKEYVKNRNNKSALFQMLIDGKCKCNVTGSCSGPQS